jgi:hypothetical protein
MRIYIYLRHYNHLQILEMTGAGMKGQNIFFIRGAEKKEERNE